MHRPLLAAAATAGLILTAATPAFAQAPGGSAKPISFTEQGVSFADELHVQCPTDSPVLHGLTLTGTVTDIDVPRPGGDATPGTEVITFSNANGWITVRNANITGFSDTVSGGVETFTYYTNGLKDLITTADGPQGSLTAAGHFSASYRFTLDGNYLGSSIVSTGRPVDAAAFCALAVDALS
jgi:hypothetical protein